MARRVSHAVHTFRLWRDAFLLAASIGLAVFLIEWGIVQIFLSSVEGAEIIGSFIAGIFFTSALTIAPASVTLAEIAETAPLFTVAFFGAIGAVIGDLILFLFIRDYIAEDLAVFAKAPSVRKVGKIFKTGFMRHLIPVVGALIIASPLPDELGLALMGLGKTRTKTLIVVSFFMNFLGVILVALMGRAL